MAYRLALLAGVLAVLSAPGGLSASETRKPGDIQQPKGTWQQPGEIQQPKGTWQVPGEIQVPKGIQAIRSEEERCKQRFLVGSDALFAFDQATLSGDAEITLQALLPLLAKAGKHPTKVDGYTDSKGTPAYNQTLSEKRARVVKEWLVAHGAVDAGTPIQGWGENHPIAPNNKPDGSDDPAGRQKNRRVAVTLDLCR
jgi:outer membrane protein OmpA-like peptidoglycan-associated protein